MLSFLRKGKVEAIHVNDLDGLLGTIELIDIREVYEYKSGSIKTAKNIPMGELLAAPHKYLQKEKKYYIMCQSGMRSGKTTANLLDQGFQVVNVSGGMGSYTGTKKN